MMQDKKKSVFNELLLREKVETIQELLRYIAEEYNVVYSLQISENHITPTAPNRNAGILIIDPMMRDEIYSEQMRFFSGEHERRLLVHNLVEGSGRIVMKCKEYTDGYELDCEYILKEIEYIDGERCYMFESMEDHGYVPSGNFQISMPKNNLRKN